MSARTYTARAIYGESLSPSPRTWDSRGSMFEDDDWEERRAARYGERTGLPPFSSVPFELLRAAPRQLPSLLLREQQRQRHRLTFDARRRGGLATAAQRTALQRAVAAMRASRARWANISAEGRREVGQRLLRARRNRVPMMRHPRPGAPKPCERCGAEPAGPYLVHPLRSGIPPTWRCQRHARASAAKYVCVGYRV